MFWIFVSVIFSFKRYTTIAYEDLYNTMRIVFWGTYDLGKPRNRIFLRGLRENDADVIECHSEVWSGIEDKSQVSGGAEKLRILVLWICAYPGLIYRYLRLPKHDLVVIGYLSQIDVLVLWPFAKLRGVPIALDAFLSLYNTVVEDRKIVRRTHPLAHFLYGVEWLACRAADRVITDTRAHADYFSKTFRLSPDKTAAVFVGVEPENFPSRANTSSPRTSGQARTVLFYGQFIPLHGIDTIVCAARLTEDLNARWVLIGRGQEETRIRSMLDAQPLGNLNWIPWVEYEELKNWIARADICLGIFGNTDKAARVIPNKVFQILAAGVPLITRDSCAIRELLSDSMEGVKLVPPADPEALAGAVRQFYDSRNELTRNRLYTEVLEQIMPTSIGRRLLELLRETRMR